MTSGFNEKGQMTISTLDENMQEYQDKYEKSFGLVDISPSSALGSDVAITAEMKKKADEFLQYAFSQNSPYEAINEGLENLCFLRGIIKKTNEHSIVLLKFTGNDGVEIPKGTAIKNTLTDELFLTNEKGTIADGEFTVFATALNSGRIVCKAGTLTELDQEIEGITSVINPSDGILGYDEESNTQLRRRLLNYSNSLNIDEELYINLLNLHNVKFVNIESNPELITDSNGIPPLSNSIIVLGGEPKDIASTIFKTYSVKECLRTFGTSLEFISSDVSKKEYPIYFSRPVAKTAVLEITIAKNNFFNPDDIGLIKESVLAYFEEKFKIADDVLIDSLYIPVQQNYITKEQFKGIKNVSILLNDSNTNMSIAYNEFATLSLDDLTILLVEE